MQADSHFVIGAAHVNGGKPCQDYATAGYLPAGGAYAVVSDGCSSGGNTDVGARIVALSTARALQGSVLVDPANFGLIQGEVALAQQIALAGAQTILGTTRDDMLATCVYAVATDGMLLAYVMGDGVVAWRLADGTLMMTRFDWDDNTPYYPAYLRENQADFAACHGGDVAAERLSSATWIVRPGGEPELHSSYRYSVARGMQGVLWPLDVFEDMTMLAVFTDGVTQVDGTDWTAAVDHLLSFKTGAGAFAKRRLNRFVKDSQETGRGPIDDLAYAVIVLDPKEA